MNSRVSISIVLYYYSLLILTILTLSTLPQFVQCDPEVDTLFNSIPLEDLASIEQNEIYLDQLLLPEVSEDNVEDLQNKFNSLAEADKRAIINKSKISGIKVLAKDLKIKAFILDMEKELKDELDASQDLFGKLNVDQEITQVEAETFHKKCIETIEAIKNSWKDHRLGKSVIESTISYFKELNEMEIEFADIVDDLSSDDRDVLRDNMDIMKASLINIFNSEKRAYELFKNIYEKEKHLYDISLNLSNLFAQSENDLNQDDIKKILTSKSQELQDFTESIETLRNVKDEL